MDLTNIINSARAAALANSIRSTRYEDLTPEQRLQIEQSLAHFDYFQGYEEEDTPAQKAQKFNAAVLAFTQDNNLQDLNPLQQFLAIIFSFLESKGVNLNTIFGGLREVPVVGESVAETLDKLSAGSPSRNWDRYRGPRADQAVDLPVTTEIEQGALGQTLAVPPSADSNHQGRYRLVTVATSSEGRNTRAEMVMLNPDGDVVWRSMMHSGSNNLRSLPGLRTAQDGRPITTEYEINWNDVRLNRRDRLGLAGMSMSDGSPGYSFTLENPDNMAEIGGAGRSAFRIHPGARGVGTAGCLEFLDSSGGISAESDRNARSFLALMTSLPADQRPVSLEVLNPVMLGQQVDVVPPRISTASRSGGNAEVEAIALASTRNSRAPNNRATTTLGNGRFDVEDIAAGASKIADNISAMAANLRLPKLHNLAISFPKFS